jgi:hypothetical protein
VVRDAGHGGNFGEAIRVTIHTGYVVVCAEIGGKSEWRLFNRATPGDDLDVRAICFFDAKWGCGRDGFGRGAHR